ncbi:MAG: hypothetical protein CSA95_00065 [Bacteroidetes bacterium]|nr:MAG: hypothetical protein CSA95_00065 [Bacteroidota bacterium]
MRKLFFLFWVLLQVLSFPSKLMAQEPDCNKLGAWIWYVSQTGFTHEELADTLSAIGVKRIYVKVSDGIMDTVWWHTIVDEALIERYHAHDMEVYGWSYNYPGSEYGQAIALYQAAETGYDGYVVDVEHQFDGDSANLYNLFNTFSFYKNLALDQHLIDTSFKLGITTWGNPIDHWYRIDVVDPFVDAYFPQTYVEIWGWYYMNNITFWVDSTNREYRSIGATKPIHHICATTQGLMTAAMVDEFMAASGAETSLWRVPGGGTPLSIWDVWNEVDWHANFCDTLIGERSYVADEGVGYPNPCDRSLTLVCGRGEVNLAIFNVQGIPMYGLRHSGEGSVVVNTSGWPAGIYVAVWYRDRQRMAYRFVKR